ncbi:MAG: polynucleotide adenylyltransferase PcnB, partial [Vicinamibacterales bacterium]
MPAPLILTRAEHPISRRDIDPDALKVLYRLHQAGYAAYLVGGGVRDLLLGRRPKDFDVGTSAHPHQVKRLFRNCWIIGRRFRLAHVKFGTKVIEVATFRRQASSLDTADDGQMPPEATVDATSAESITRHVHRDNSFGTEEEDAFRRDFTVNALFYDIATFSVIDHVGGIDDLRARLIRCIGDPRVRFVEDPVRMLRAIVLAARLDFKIDPPVLQAIMEEKAQIVSASPARLMEEYYKVLRSGSALRAFHLLGEVGLLQLISPEIPWPLPHGLEHSLAELDEYRGRHERTPDTLSNPILLGSLIVPLGLLSRRRARPAGGGERTRPALPTLGALPLARRDVETAEHALALQSRLADVVNLTPRAQRGLMHRSAIRDALTWLEIHGQQPDTLER